MQYASIGSLEQIRTNKIAISQVDMDGGYQQRPRLERGRTSSSRSGGLGLPTDALQPLRTTAGFPYWGIANCTERRLRFSYPLIDFTNQPSGSLIIL
jgi:hypothetical protein